MKTLKITECPESEEESLLIEKNWDNFFNQIVKKIEEGALEGVAKNFMCDFSTTTNTHRVISASLLMNSFKKFFHYYRRLGISCGISNVYMAGIR